METNVLQADRPPSWVWLGQIGFVPALIYVATVALGAVFGVRAPARFLAEGLLAASWGAPVLYLMVFGGLVFTVVSSLVLQRELASPSRWSRVTGWLAFALLVVCVPLMLFGVLFVFMD